MYILIIIALIVLNALFSMVEMALVSSNKFKLESMVKAGSKGAAKALEMYEDPTDFLSMVMIVLTLIGILLGIYSGEIDKTWIEATISKVGFLQPYSATLATGIVVLIITYFTIVFGELLPKKIGITFPEPIIEVLAKASYFILLMMLPFVWLLSNSNNLILRLMGIRQNKDDSVSEREILSIIKESTTTGEVQDIEQEIVDRVFRLGDRKIESLMTHRRDIIFIDMKDSLNEIDIKTKQEPHSAYPVTENNSIDEIVGIIYMKDLFQSVMTNPFKLSKWVRKPIYFFENTPTYQVLEEFRTKRVHCALITDEYGAI